MIVDKDDVLSRVSVKFTGYKYDDNYVVDLRSCGGANGSKVYSNFIYSSASYLFVVTEESKLYLIPKEAVHTTTRITLNEVYEDYVVTI